ncbi:MAG: GAF domain-containing protein [Verrucomicrobium sp.]|nr:GAF domain-containing protein [Verrucomicrobium sp.]
MSSAQDVRGVPNTPPDYGPAYLVGERGGEHGIPDQLIERWQEMVDLMSRIVGVPAGLVMRVMEQSIEVFVSGTSKENPYQAGHREPWVDSGLYCEEVLKTGKVLLVPDARVDTAWESNPDIKLGMISYLGFPIHWPDNRPFGTLCVLDRVPREFTEDQMGLIRQFRDLMESNLAAVDEHARAMQTEAELFLHRERLALATQASGQGV